MFSRDPQDYPIPEDDDESYARSAASPAPPSPPLPHPENAIRGYLFRARGTAAQDYAIAVPIEPPRPGHAAVHVQDLYLFREKASYTVSLGAGQGTLYQIWYETRGPGDALRPLNEDIRGLLRRGARPYPMTEWRGDVVVLKVLVGGGGRRYSSVCEGDLEALRHYFFRCWIVETGEDRCGAGQACERLSWCSQT